MGLCDGKLVEKLQLDADLTLKKVVTHERQFEAEKQQPSLLKGSVENHRPLTTHVGVVKKEVELN